MANLSAEQYDTLQEVLKLITEARQTSERLSEIWAKGLANLIGPHTTHLSSPITPMTPSQSPQPPDPVMIPEKTAIKSDPFIEPLERASVLQVAGSVSDVFLVHRVDSHVKEVEELPQESTNSNEKNVAHQVFDETPLAVSKEKQRKSLKAWKFKFKISFKRSRLMDDMFKFVEETAWLNRDPKETIWDCVNKEFKETMAGCVKKRVDTFKLIDEIKSRLSRANHVWKPGGVLTEMDLRDCPKKESKSYQGSHQSFDGKKSSKTLYLEDEHEQTEVMKFISSWNNYVWEPGGVLIEHDKWKGLEKCYKRGRLMRLMHWLSSMWWKGIKFRKFDMCVTSNMGTRIVLYWKKLASILWFLHGKKLLDAGQKMQSMLASDFKAWVPHFGYELHLAGTDPVLGLVWSSFEDDMNRLGRGPEAVLSFNSEKMVLDWFFQRDLHKSCLDIRRMITLLCSSADYRKLNLWVDTNYCEIRPDKTHVKLQEMSCFLSEKSLVEFVGYKAHGRELLVMVVKQLTLAATKFHLKHKWRSRLLQTLSRLEFCVDNVILFTSSVKLLFPKNHKLLHYETGFCTQYNDLELLSTEHHSSPGLDYFTYLIFIWKQVLNCCCEAGHVSSRVFSVGGVHGFEAQRKMMLVLNEIPLLENHNKVDLTIEENWFYNKPMIREVFHLQRPPELFDLHENLDFITKVLVQWKEHPPDQFFSGFYGQVLMLSSLRTRMF